jgi:hypothetical protein
MREDSRSCPIKAIAVDGRRRNAQRTSRQESSGGVESLAPLAGRTPLNPVSLWKMRMWTSFTNKQQHLEMSGYPEDHLGL